MLWLPLLIAGVLAFAIVFDLVARARGRYRPAGDWDAARRRRKSRRRSFRADPEDPRSR